MLDSDYLTFDKFKKLGENKKNFKLVNKIYEALENANDDKGISKLNEALLEHPGYTGLKTKHFLNNLCEMTPCNYLETGCFTGAAGLAACYKNNTNAVFIDKNLDYLKTHKTGGEFLSKYMYCIERDVSDPIVHKKLNKFIEKHGKFNVFVCHSMKPEIVESIKLLNFYKEYLDTSEFILIVEDWNWYETRDSVFEWMRENKFDVVFRHEIILEKESLESMPEHKGKWTWWNGLGIFVLSNSS